MWHYPPGWLPASALAIPTPAHLVTVPRLNPGKPTSDHCSLLNLPKTPPLKPLKAKVLTVAYKALRTQLPTTSLTPSQLLFSFFQCSQTGLQLLLNPNSVPLHMPAQLQRALRLQRFMRLTPSSPPQGLLNCHFRASLVTSLFIFSHSTYDSLAYYIFYLFYWLSPPLKDKSRRTQIVLDSDLFTVTSLAHREAPSI